MTVAAKKIDPSAVFGKKVEPLEPKSKPLLTARPKPSATMAGPAKDPS